MKTLIILFLFLSIPFYKHTLNDELVECEILYLYTYIVERSSLDTIELIYLAKSEYCYLVLTFNKLKNNDTNFKKIEIGGKYLLHLKFLPETNNITDDVYSPSKFHYSITNLRYKYIGLHFNTDSLYELDYYYKNNLRADSLAFNYLPLNVKGNYIHDSLIIYQP